MGTYDETVKGAIDRLNEPEADTKAEELRILGLLPDGMFAPTISNVARHEWEPAAWLSFHGPSYDPDHQFDPVAILRTLDANGWRTIPATLVKLDNYRPSPKPWAQDQTPEEWGCICGKPYRVTGSWPICPLWVMPNTHTGPEACCYMRGPDGNTYYVHISANGLPCHIHARRYEYRGGWNYERGTARLAYPPAWETLEHDGQPIAQRHARSGAQVDTGQGISGQLYWEPIAHEQADFPLSAAGMLSLLFATK